MTKELDQTSPLFSANVIFINEIYQKFLQKSLKISLENRKSKKILNGYLDLYPISIQEVKLFKNTNLVVEPEFTSGEATTFESQI